MTENTPAGSSESVVSTTVQSNGNMLAKIGKYGLLAAGALIVFGVMQGRHGVSCSSADARETVSDIAKEHDAMLHTIRAQGNGPGIPVEAKCEQDAGCVKIQQELDSAKAAATKLAVQCNAISSLDMYDRCPENGSSVTAKRSDGSYQSWGTSVTGPDGYGPEHDTPRKIFMTKYAQPITDRLINAEAAMQAATNQLQRQNSDRGEQAWSAAVQNLKYQLENVIMTDTNKDTGSVSCKAQLVGDVPNWGSATSDITYTIEKTSDGQLYATVWGIEG